MKFNCCTEFCVSNSELHKHTYSIVLTELHEHAYTVLLLLWYKYALFTNKVWEFNYSIAPPSYIRVSLSISELHQRAYSHCSLSWCEKGIAYQQVI